MSYVIPNKNFQYSYHTNATSRNAPITVDLSVSVLKSFFKRGKIRKVCISYACLTLSVQAAKYTFKNFSILCIVPLFGNPNIVHNNRNMTFSPHRAALQDINEHLHMTSSFQSNTQ